MKFHTHDRTPSIKTRKSLKIMLIVEYGFMFAVFAFVAIVCSIYANSIAPAVLILTSLFALTALIKIIGQDMRKAYVEINDNKIIVVDYYFGIKKEKAFLTQDIANAEILIGRSMRVRGYRYSNVGCTYIVFRDNRGKYLFKIMYFPETKQFFDKYINQY